ncbi:hypothetical protein GCM10018793_56390 [Streptomyces sulfonofaciens]|uniref:NACHT domain-containing protein n=1 Tax=Streptomyces sulfonofaciens TaxID=68272 RepID=A0A919GKQ7_9ACTN|nr:hypothetical protein [Streptomyces sulfonofaciens]GHH86009.1 hypothetical protein GCM10018793_56390 [Streptomyces sulfonofaciens]
MDLARYLRRRRARLGLLIVFTLLSAGLGWALHHYDGSDLERFVGNMSLFVSVAALAVAVVTLLPPLAPPREAAELADYLADTVSRQWQEEVSSRQLREPRVIPIAWSATRRPVSEPPEAVVGPVDARILRLSLDGRLDGDFDTSARRLAEGFHRIPSRRLVVLGEPGSGKTVLAAMLTLGLLEAREPRSPVPVLLSISTWDPVMEPLDEWIVQSLATAYYGGRPDLPRRLMAGRLLLPVLDGLDEMPESARRSAVHKVNDACGEGRGVVLTCRSAEYQDVIAGGSPALRRAPVVEVSPVPVPDVLAYLREVNWPCGVDWEPVWAHIEAHPEGPLASALSTPLALSLARTVYRAYPRDPGELLVPDSRHGVEDHLVDQVVRAAYAPPPCTRRADEAEWLHRAERAERYLAYLAAYLHRHQERDVAWWLMSRRLLSRWAGIALGIAAGLVLMLAVAATAHVVDPGAGTLEANLAIGPATAVLAMLSWYGAQDRPPGRLSPSLRGSLERLRGGALVGLKLGALLLLPIMLTTAAVITVGGGWSASSVTGYGRALALEAGAVATVSIALAVHGWLNAPPEQSAGAGPRGLLRLDRRSAVTGALTGGVVFSLLLVPLLLLSTFLAYVAFLALVRDGHVTLPSGFSQTFSIHSAADDDSADDGPLGILALTLLPGAVFALLVLLTRAWTRFTVVRLVLAAQGVLPWRLMAFLADARDRQLLRQSAGTYQFRHIRLQERLAARPPAPRPASPRRAALRRRAPAVTGALVLVVSALAAHGALPHDTSRTLLATGGIEAMAFAPERYHLLVTLDEHGRLRWWDTRDGHEYRDRSRMLSIAWPEDDAVYDSLHYALDDVPVPVLMTSGQHGLEVLRVPPASANPSVTGFRWRDGRRSTYPLYGSAPRDASTGSVPLVLGPRGAYVVVAESPQGHFSDVAIRTRRTGTRHGAPVPWSERLPALSADGNRLADRDRKGLVVYDTLRGRPACTADGDFGAPATDAGGTRVAAAVEDDTGDAAAVEDDSGDTGDAADKGTVRVWDRTSPDGAPGGHGTCRSVLSLRAAMDGSGPVDALALSEDGRMLAASAGGTTRIWDLP